MLKRSHAVILLLFMSLLFIAAGCGTKVEHYKPIEKCLNNNQYEKAPELVKEARGNDSYEEKDRVLYYLDLGITNHYAHNYNKSNKNLEKAEHNMQELYTKSLTNKGWSILTNNNELPYYGEEYENIYINVFKALNFVNMDKPDKAFVEIRDMYEKIDYMQEKYQKKAKKYKNSSMANEQAKEAIEEKRGDLKIESKFTDSALGRYFNYAMYSSAQDLDDANISLDNMKKAFAEQKDIYNFDVPASLAKPQSGKEKVLVHSIAMLGNGPIKKQNEIRLQLPKLGYVKFVMPELIRRGTNITSVRLLKNDEPIAELEKIEDVNNVAQSVFNMKRPIILYKNMFRTVVKKVGGTAAAEVAEEAGGGLAKLGAQIAAAIYTEVSEQADLRTSRLLPGEFRVASFYMKPGQHQLQAEFYSGEQLVQCKDIKLKVSKNDFNMIELVNFI